MELVLQQRQTLNLKMTVELRQAISLLQYSTYDLYQFIQEQELENPIIELIEKENVNPYKEKGRTERKSINSGQDPLHAIANNTKGLSDYLEEQVQWLDIGEKEKSIVYYLILNLDENGYLPLSDEEVSTHLSVSESEVNKGIALLQQLDPVGVGARNLKECLLLQQRYNNPEERIAEKIIEDHLDMLGNKKWNEITKNLGVSLSEVRAAYEYIRTLNPKPCNDISDVTTEYLNPDIIVHNNSGKFVAYLNDSYLPEIRFNNHYLDLLNNKSSVSNYMHKHYKSYKWLLSSIEQRRTTILKIVKVIIKEQRDFFENGFSALKPLTLKQVADEINMHESTVSRATMNKVIQTPKGSFDLRKLFTSKLNTTNGNSMSQAKVKILLKEFVQNENKNKPFSDQKIADYFKTIKGISISRRTVAKYREELNIPSSRKRKEFEI